MARLSIGSLNFSDSAAPEQLVTTKSPRLIGLTLKARPGNAESIFVYTGGDSSGTSETSYEILPGDREEWLVEPPTQDPSTIWVFANDSGDNLDYTLLFEE